MAVTFSRKRPISPSRATPGRSAEDAQIRVEEYKRLNDEILLLIKDTRALELYFLGGIAAYYSWIFLNFKNVPDAFFLWFAPIAAVGIGTWRIYANYNRMREIAAYMRHHFPIAKWEGTLRRFSRREKHFPGKGVAALFRKTSFQGFWIVLFVFVCSVSLYGWTRGLHAPPPACL